MNVYVSLPAVRDRRQQRRRQRQQLVLQNFWRLALGCGLVWGLCWGLTLPRWRFDRVEVVVEGNRRLTADTIRERLAAAAEQSLWQVEPQNLERALATTAPVAEATVERRLLPPRVTVTVRERPPVAMTQPVSPEQADTTQTPAAVPGFLDATGIWMPQSSYTDPDRERDAMALSAIGYGEHYRQEWKKLYHQLQESPIAVRSIDWRDPSNLIVHTELGIAHCGPYGRRFPAQLIALSRLRNLPERVDVSQISYIDLRDPDTPAIAFEPTAAEATE
ncbi:cell division septal protein [Rubidibacter lacunae KORDI 51-2]|uniref:Cell division septal protein n=1 Tax=Rubidibacter lacunae KORDI 51-2 TaxID=582515 RepID=U5DM97_9CHRO|nr:FtsQ-type POTRA domain-containing protein [Rubidibacter lacunae]ERN42801.1 cell division septal protein [Rubidibacter lacunae KORDI 51-2]